MDWFITTLKKKILKHEKKWNKLNPSLLSNKYNKEDLNLSLWKILIKKYTNC